MPKSRRFLKREIHPSNVAVINAKIQAVFRGRIYPIRTTRIYPIWTARSSPTLMCDTNVMHVHEKHHISVHGATTMAADRLEKTCELLLQAVESIRDSTSSSPPPVPERNSAPPNASQASGYSERASVRCERNRLFNFFFGEKSWDCGRKERQPWC